MKLPDWILGVLVLFFVVSTMFYLMLSPIWDLPTKLNIYYADVYAEVSMVLTFIIIIFALVSTNKPKERTGKTGLVDDIYE